MKKTLIGIGISIALIMGLFIISYMTNPLVANGKINLAGFGQIQMSSLLRNADKMGFMAAYAYSVSDKNQRIEDYSIYLYEKASNFGDIESDVFLGLYFNFIKNDTSKGLQYFNKVMKKSENVGNLCFAIHYILKEKNYEKGIDLLKKLQAKNFRSVMKINLEDPINYESIQKEMENLKNVYLEKKDMGVEFGW